MQTILKHSTDQAFAIRRPTYTAYPIVKQHDFWSAEYAYGPQSTKVDGKRRQKVVTEISQNGVGTCARYISTQLVSPQTSRVAQENALRSMQTLTNIGEQKLNTNKR